jgi:hypothetical protein
MIVGSIQGCLDWVSLFFFPHSSWMRSASALWCSLKIGEVHRHCITTRNEHDPASTKVGNPVRTELPWSHLRRLHSVPK